MNRVLRPLADPSTYAELGFLVLALPLAAAGLLLVLLTLPVPPLAAHVARRLAAAWRTLAARLLDVGPAEPEDAGRPQFAL